MSDTLAKLGATIVRLRKEKQLSQEALAKQSGITHRYLSDVENGKKAISLLIFEKISRGLGVSMSELMKQVESED